MTTASRAADQSRGEGLHRTATEVPQHGRRRQQGVEPGGVQEGLEGDGPEAHRHADAPTIRLLRC